MKIICVGKNYAAHAQELNSSVPDQPLIFLKPDSSILRKGFPFFIPDFSNDVQHEVEVVVKIDKVGKAIDEKFAHRYYSEIALGIDFTARDMQNYFREKGFPWELSKGFDGATFVSDFFPKEQFNIQELSFHLDKNKHTVQKGNTALMAFKIDSIISFVSKFFTLKKGDLIFTGTPAGVSKVDPGDILEGYIEEEKVFEVLIK